MFKLDSPYKVAGRWYVPREDPNYDEYGVASWYGADFHGRRTANGEVFDANALTAAHPTLPLPCYAYVTNVDNGRTVLVRVNDRGPYVNDRLIDMSYAAAKALGYVSTGRARVRVRYAGRAPLNGDDSQERWYLASQQGVPSARPPVMLASTREYPNSTYSGYSASDRYSTSSYDRRTLPADASDRWSPIGYRASLAGKPAPVPKAQARMRTPDEPLSVASNYQRPMALSALPEPRPFGSVRSSYVQVGIFRERSNAERLRRELGALGPIEVAPLQVDDGGEVYRVRMGPFSPDAASRAQDQIATYGVGDTAIVAD